jgi:hypothetical protein
VNVEIVTNGSTVVPDATILQVLETQIYKLTKSLYQNLTNGTDPTGGDVAAAYLLVVTTPVSEGPRFSTCDLKCIVIIAVIFPTMAAWCGGFIYFWRRRCIRLRKRELAEAQPQIEDGPEDHTRWEASSTGTAEDRDGGSARFPPSTAVRRFNEPFEEVRSDTSMERAARPAVTLGEASPSEPTASLWNEPFAFEGVAEYSNEPARSSPLETAEAFGLYIIPSPNAAGLRAQQDSFSDAGTRSPQAPSPRAASTTVRFLSSGRVSSAISTVFRHARSAGI